MRTLVIALMVLLGGSALAIATPVAQAGFDDICLSYWYCVIECNTPPDYYCKCRPECPPPPEPEW